MISTKIISQAAELKVLVSRVMSQEDRERAVRCCNGIMAEAERVAGLEQEPLRAGGPGQVGGAS